MVNVNELSIEKREDNQIVIKGWTAFGDKKDFWVARIEGLDQKFGLAREFVQISKEDRANRELVLKEGLYEFFSRDVMTEIAVRGFVLVAKPSFVIHKDIAELDERYKKEPVNDEQTTQKGNRPSTSRGQTQL